MKYESIFTTPTSLNASSTKPAMTAAGTMDLRMAGTTRQSPYAASRATEM